MYAALEKLTRFYLKNEFRNSARRFLEEFTSTVLATVAARFKLFRGVSCFWPKIIIGVMTIPPSSSFQLLDGLIACGWGKDRTARHAQLNFNHLSSVGASWSAIPARSTLPTTMS